LTIDRLGDDTADDDETKGDGVGVTGATTGSVTTGVGGKVTTGAGGKVTTGAGGKVVTAVGGVAKFLVLRQFKGSTTEPEFVV
jgi:hypothetical protein